MVKLKVKMSRFYLILLLSFVLILLLIVGLAQQVYYESSSNYESELNNDSARVVNPCDDCDVYIILVDALRADHLSVYGYHKNTSPSLVNFAKDSVVYENAFSQSHNTLPSHASIFTSVLPIEHKLGNRGYIYNQAGEKEPISADLDTKFFTIASLLYPEYKTIATFDQLQLYKNMTLFEGFQSIIPITRGKNLQSDFNEQINVFAGFAEVPGKLFAFLHTLTVHGPYVCPQSMKFVFNSNLSSGRLNLEYMKTNFSSAATLKNYSDVEKQFIVRLYDSCIIDADLAFDNFIRILKKTGRYDNSMIIFTSDHGEFLGERELYEHAARGLYDQVIHVPLIIKYPDSFVKKNPALFTRGRVTSLVRSIDIAPTILEVVGKEMPNQFKGKSVFLLPFEEKSRVSISQVDDKSFAFTQMTVRDINWKLDNKNQLINLITDPNETMDLAQDFAEIANELLQIKEDLLIDKMNSNSSSTTTTLNVDDDTLETLKSLGYI